MQGIPSLNGNRCPMMMTSAAALLLLCCVFTAQASAPSCAEGCRCFRVDGLKAANCTSLAQASAIAPHLKVLRLDQTQSIVHPGAFSLFYNLERLYLDHNGIRKVLPGAFRGLHRLELLDLSHNHLAELSEVAESLLDLPGLHKLRLRGNPIGDLRSAAAFLTSKTLSFLDLGLCKIHTLPDDAFRKLTNLKHLKLDRNHIATFKASTFPKILISLDLSENNIRDVPTKELSTLKNLEKFELSGNPIHCTCHFLDVRGEFVMVKPVVCRSPEEYKGMNLMDVERKRICGPKVTDGGRAKRQLEDSKTEHNDEDTIGELEDDVDDDESAHPIDVNADVSDAADETDAEDSHLADEGVKDGDEVHGEDIFDDDDGQEKEESEKEQTHEDEPLKEVAQPEHEDANPSSLNDNVASGDEKTVEDDGDNSAAIVDQPEHDHKDTNASSQKDNVDAVEEKPVEDVEKDNFPAGVEQPEHDHEDTNTSSQKDSGDSGEEKPAEDVETGSLVANVEQAEHEHEQEDTHTSSQKGNGASGEEEPVEDVETDNLDADVEQTEHEDTDASSQKDNGDSVEEKPADVKTDSLVANVEQPEHIAEDENEDSAEQQAVEGAPNTSHVSGVEQAADSLKHDEVKEELHVSSEAPAVHGDEDAAESVNEAIPDEDETDDGEETENAELDSNVDSEDNDDEGDKVGAQHEAAEISEHHSEEEPDGSPSEVHEDEGQGKESGHSEKETVPLVAFSDDESGNDNALEEDSGEKRVSVDHVDNSHEPQNGNAEDQVKEKGDHGVDEKDNGTKEDGNGEVEVAHHENVMDNVDTSAKLVESSQDSKEETKTESPLAVDDEHDVPLLGVHEKGLVNSDEVDSVKNEDNNPDGEEQRQSSENSDEGDKIEQAEGHVEEVPSVADNEISSDGEDDVEHTDYNEPSADAVDGNVHTEVPLPSKEPESSAHVIEEQGMEHVEEAAGSTEEPSHEKDTGDLLPGSHDIDEEGKVDNVDSEEEVGNIEPKGAGDSDGDENVTPKSDDELLALASGVHVHELPSGEEDETTHGKDAVDGGEEDPKSSQNGDGDGPIPAVHDDGGYDEYDYGVDPSEDKLDSHVSGEASTEKPVTEHVNHDPAVEVKTESSPDQSVVNVMESSANGNESEYSEIEDNADMSDDRLEEAEDDMEDDIVLQEDKDEHPLEANTDNEDEDHVEEVMGSISESPLDNEEDATAMVDKDELIRVLPAGNYSDEGSGYFPGPEDGETETDDGGNGAAIDEEEEDGEGSGDVGFILPQIIDDRISQEVSTSTPDGEHEPSASGEGSGVSTHHTTEESSTPMAVVESIVHSVHIDPQELLPPREEVETSTVGPLEKNVEEEPTPDERNDTQGLGRGLGMPVVPVDDSTEVPDAEPKTTEAARDEGSVDTVEVETPATNQTLGEIKESVNEIGVSSGGTPEQQTPTKAAQNSEGAYVVLGVIMVIIVLLLGYSVFRSRRQKSSAQTKEKDVENQGRELHDVSKPLIGNGHGPEKPPLDDTRQPLMPKEEQQFEDEDERKPKIGNGLSTFTGPSDRNADPGKKEEPEVVVEKSPQNLPSALVSTNPFRAQPTDDSSVPNMYGAAGSDTTDDDVFTSEHVPTRPTPANGLAAPMVNGNGLSSFQEPPVSPSSGRVRVVAKELPDSVAKKPVFITMEQ